MSCQRRRHSCEAWPLDRVPGQAVGLMWKALPSCWREHGCWSEMSSVKLVEMSSYATVCTEALGVLCSAFCSVLSDAVDAPSMHCWPAGSVDALALLSCTLGLLRDT